MIGRDKLLYGDKNLSKFNVILSLLGSVACNYLHRINPKRVIQKPVHLLMLAVVDDSVKEIGVDYTL